jgi:hypothetical protein
MAHYLTLVIQGAIWLPTARRRSAHEPLATARLDPDRLRLVPQRLLDRGGHVAGIVLAHRLALRDSPSRPVVAGLPMVALMIGYTVLSLWIIAQPIVLEPGPVPSALLAP